jgi:hypothetical protein
MTPLWPLQDTDDPGPHRAAADGSEKRMFECTKCHFIETKTVADPLKSDAVERLTTNVRPLV